MSKIIVGLDIGTTKIACIIGERTENGKLRILGHGKTESIGVVRGVVLNVLETERSIRKAVDEASRQANYQVSEVYVGIAGQHVKGMQTTGNIMIPDHDIITEEDVARLINEQRMMLLPQGEQIVHVFPQCFFVDNEPLPDSLSPVGVTGKNLSAQFHIVTCNTDNLLNISRSVERAGLKIKNVVLEPIASSYAVLTKMDREAGVVLVDIGGGTTDMAIFSDDVIRYTSVIPLAGNIITEDIRKGCGILKPQAEQVKVKYGSCLPSLESVDDIISIPGICNQPPREIAAKSLAGIIKARLNIILEQVDYEIEQSGMRKNLLGGVVLTGGGARMKHIDELSELVTKAHCRIGTPDAHLVDSDSELAHPMYATGVGLVLYGFELDGHDESEETDQISNADPNDPFDNDIFKSMPDEQQQPLPDNSTSTPHSSSLTPQPSLLNPHPSPADKSWLGNIARFLTDFFTEGQDGSDEQETQRGS